MLPKVVLTAQEKDALEEFAKSGLEEQSEIIAKIVSFAIKHLNFGVSLDKELTRADYTASKDASGLMNIIALLCVLSVQLSHTYFKDDDYKRNPSLIPMYYLVMLLALPSMLYFTSNMMLLSYNFEKLEKYLARYHFGEKNMTAIRMKIKYEARDRLKEPKISQQYVDALQKLFIKEGSPHMKEIIEKRSFATPWYVYGKAIGLYTASDFAVDCITNSIDSLINEEFKSQLKSCKTNAEKIIACIKFKLGDQWDSFADILKDPISLEEVIFDAVFNKTGNTYGRESIIVHFKGSNLDPLTDIELDESEKILIPNIALAGLLAFIALSVPEVNIREYPGFMDIATSKTFVKPVLDQHGVTIEGSDPTTATMEAAHKYWEQNPPVNILLKQLIAQFLLSDKNRLNP